MQVLDSRKEVALLSCCRFAARCPAASYPPLKRRARLTRSLRDLRPNWLQRFYTFGRRADRH